MINGEIAAQQQRHNSAQKKIHRTSNVIVFHNPHRLDNLFFFTSPSVSASVVVVVVYVSVQRGRSSLVVIEGHRRIEGLNPRNTDNGHPRPFRVGGVSF